MSDQANQLRELVRQASTPRAATSRARLIVVAGGKGGVGTTTVAVGLAVALAAAGRRVAVVDADPDGGSVATIFGIEERATIADVLAGKVALSDALAAGPAGVEVLAGAWGVDLTAECSPAAQQRLLAQLRDLDPRAEVAVVDAGNGTHSWAQRWWRAADRVLLVTGAELVSVLSTYAGIKVLSAGDASLSVSTLVNRAASEADAAEVWGRLQRACWRFLGLRLGSWWWLPDVPRTAEVGAAADGILASAVGGPIASGLLALAESLVDGTPGPITERRPILTTAKKGSTGNCANADMLRTVR